MKKSSKIIITLAIILVIILLLILGISIAVKRLSTYYNVSFNLNGGTPVIAEQTVRSGRKAKRPTTTLEKTGYTFTDWCSDEELKTVYDFSLPVTENISLYAKWTANTYTISFDANGGSGDMSAQSFTYDTPQQLEFLSFKAPFGKSFTSWNTAANGSGTSYDEGIEILNLSAENNATITFYAQWSSDFYRIVFEPNGATGGRMVPQIMKKGLAQDLKMNSYTPPVGKHFGIWTEFPDGTGKIYIDGQNISIDIEHDEHGNVHIYARWSYNFYKVKFNANGGMGAQMFNQIFKYDEESALNMNTYTAPQGYTFDKWNSKPDGTGTTYTDKQLVSALTDVNNGVFELYAQWKPITYKVYFDANGGTGAMDPQTLTYDEVTALSKNTFTAPAGQVFSFWTIRKDGKGTFFMDEELVSSLTPSPSITLYAQWDNDKYTVTFLPGEGSGDMPQQEFTYNVASPLPTNQFTYEHYKFKDWMAFLPGGPVYYANEHPLNIDFRLSSGNLSLYARWIPYSIEFNPGNTDLPDASDNTSYTTIIPAAQFAPGGTGTINYKIYASALPDGLTLDASGTLSGIPTSGTGIYKFLIVAYCVETGVESDSVMFSLAVTEGQNSIFIIDTINTPHRIDGVNEDYLYIESISIPSSLNGVEITEINTKAFDELPKLKSVFFPATVTTIGAEAFWNCTKLETVTFEAGSALKTIGDSAFMACSALTAITIPASVTLISKTAFYTCISLETLTFEAGGAENMTIDDGAFMTCNSLSLIKLPSRITVIGSNVFRDCFGITTIDCVAPSKPAGWKTDWLGNITPTVNWGA